MSETGFRAVSAMTNNWGVWSVSNTVFTKVDYSLGALISSIELGNIGLPDIQRPFVWKNTKVRNLFDSLYRGFPVGYLLFWENDSGGRAIGTETKQLASNLLIVDGQQRLTALYAVLKGEKVIRENWESEHIEIAFNPLEEKFQVADAAIRRDKSFVPNISVIWDKNTLLYKFTENFLTELKGTRDLSEEEVGKIHEAFARLHNLNSYPFTALQLASSIDDEQVSEVFVRINSEGKSLNQADFILTLMSVFWDEGRSDLERFCREARTPTSGQPSSFNHFIEPSPDQLLRVGIGLGFRRAKLTIVYSILRGKDLDTGNFSPDLREQQFSILKSSQEKVLNLVYWHDFLKSLLFAGYRSEKLINSANTLLFTYIFYLLGRTEYGVKEHRLRQVIAPTVLLFWFRMAWAA